MLLQDAISVTHNFELNTIAQMNLSLQIATCDPFSMLAIMRESSYHGLP